MTGRLEDGSVVGMEDEFPGSTIGAVVVGIDEECIGSAPATVLGAMRPGRNSNTGRNCRRVRMEGLRP
jgi:hypothetical protein